MTNIFRIFSKLAFNNILRDNIKFYCGATTNDNLNSLLSSIYEEEMGRFKKRFNSIEGTRYNGRIKRRKWEESQNESQETKMEGEASLPFERIKRKKSVILLAYLGANYYGMQRNPGMKTIEEDLLNALLKSNYITEVSYKQMQQMHFQRAARTDKGVSAAMQIVSLKLPDPVDVEEINKFLPPEIRVFSIKRVTKGFNSKSSCDARTYTYLVPTYALEDHTKKIEDFITYRVSKEKIESVNSLLKSFEGSKNFHNFTSRKKFLDPSSRRYIMSFTCGDPFTLEDMEFAVIKVKGQSFMLHQIRKMVGLTLAIVRGHTTKDRIELSWTPDGFDIPTAPGLGLVLDEIHYEKYNARYGADGIHETLTWDNIQDKLEAFKKDIIYHNIAKQEKNDMNMANWLETLSLHSYDVRGDGPVKNEEDGIDEDSEEEDSRNDQNDEDVIIKDSVNESVAKVEDEILSEKEATACKGVI